MTEQEPPDAQDEDQQPEEFLNRAARRAKHKSGARLDRSAAPTTAGHPAKSGGGPSTRQFSNRRTGG